MSTTATKTSATDTAATGDVFALTTTFTPPARCTQTSHMFSMLAPSYEIWINDPVPVSGSTVSSCYPTEWLESYTSTTTISSFTGKATQHLSSIVPALSPMVCPLSWETVLTAPGNYIACCPPSYSLASPQTTKDGYRPAYGGTCYSDLSSGQVLTQVTQYNNQSISATIPFTATAAGAQVYAHPMDGYSYQEASVTVFQTQTANSSTTTTTSPATLASATQSQSSSATPEASASSSLSGGAIAGVVIGVVAGVALLAALVFFLLRRRRNAPEAEEVGDAPVSEATREPPQTPAAAEEVKSPVVAEMYSPGRHELAIDRGVNAELSGEAREPAELDTGYSSMDGKGRPLF